MSHPTPLMLKGKRAPEPPYRPRPPLPPAEPACSVAYREAQERAYARQADRIVRSTVGWLR